MGGSRWADAEEDAALDARRKLEKEEKKRLKAEKARKAEERKEQLKAAEAQKKASDEEQAAKRRKLEPEQGENPTRRVQRVIAPTWGPAGNIDDYEVLNSIEEGSYGCVSRAKLRATGQVVALKKLKMDGSEHSGFPVTGLREIQCLMACRHENVVDLQRVVVGGTGGHDVYMVMEFLEHDLKTLMEEMREPFLASETKTLMLQLTGALEYLHENWIIHRDLKTSNILMNNRGTLKIADFGMARSFSNPPPPALTTLVVTLWYRAPELLLGSPHYDRSIDIWSLGCIFGELLTNEPLLSGKNEVDQLTKSFELCGLPSEKSWPGFRRLPNAKGLKLPRDYRGGNKFRTRFPTLTKAGIDLLQDLLELNPEHRPTASQILQDSYFKEDPRPKNRAMFPTFPSKAGGERRRRFASPSAPKRGDAPGLGGEELDFSGILSASDGTIKGAGFQLKV